MTQERFGLLGALSSLPLLLFQSNVWFTVLFPLGGVALWIAVWLGCRHGEKRKLRPMAALALLMSLMISTWVVIFPIWVGWSRWLRPRTRGMVVSDVGEKGVYLGLALAIPVSVLIVFLALRLLGGRLDGWALSRYVLATWLGIAIVNVLLRVVVGYEGGWIQGLTLLIWVTCLAAEFGRGLEAAPEADARGGLGKIGVRA